ncbi:MAG: PilZ domain-containing protein [Bdellovibrionota bacterium]
MADVKKSSIQKKSGCYLLNIKQPERTAKRLKVAFQRISVSISTLKNERKIDAAVGLVDLSEVGAGFFTSELLAKGSGVEIFISDPMILKIRALVAWSIPIESGIQNARFPCRSGLQFIYDNDIQRQAVKDFLEKIVANPMDHYRRSFSASPPVTGVAPDVVPMAAEGAATFSPPADATAPAAETTAPAADAGPAFSTATDAAPAAAPVLAEAPAPAAEVAPAATTDAPAAETKPEGEDSGGQSQAA